MMPRHSAFFPPNFQPCCATWLKTLTKTLACIGETYWLCQCYFFSQNVFIVVYTICDHNANIKLSTLAALVYCPVPASLTGMAAQPL